MVSPGRGKPSEVDTSHTCLSGANIMTVESIHNFFSNRGDLHKEVVQEVIILLAPLKQKPYLFGASTCPVSPQWL